MPPTHQHTQIQRPVPGQPGHLALSRRQIVLGALAGLPLGAARVPAAAAASAPPTAYLPGDSYVERYRQKWALSCEYAALHTALRLLGKDVSEDVMRALLGRGEDPDETFRGEIQANQTLDNYGVHARGIARLLELLKASGHAPKEFSSRLLYDMEDVRLALAQGQPVVAWLPLGLRASSRVPTRLSSGKTVTLVYAEHCVTLRGYDGTYFYALEPYNGSAPAYETNALWRAMTLVDDPALAIAPAPGPAPAAAPPPAPPPAPPATSQFFAETGITLEGGFYATYRDLGGREALGLPITPELPEMDAVSEEPKQVLYTEAGRLEWHPGTGRFGLGYAGQELLGEEARPDPDRPLVGAIARYVAQQGGIRRFGYSISDEFPIDAEYAELLPWPIDDAVGQWFQTCLLIWSSDTGVVPGRAGWLLAEQRGLIG